MIYNAYNRRLERWIINHQTGRRNLTKSQLVKAYASVEEQLKREAKERQVVAGKEFGKGGSKVPSNLTEAISKAPETAEVVAKKIGVSKNTYKGMKQIVSEGTPEQIKRMDEGGKNSPHVDFGSQKPKSQESSTGIISTGRGPNIMNGPLRNPNLPNN